MTSGGTRGLALDTLHNISIADLTDTMIFLPPLHWHFLLDNCTIGLCNSALAVFYSRRVLVSALYRAASLVMLSVHCDIMMRGGW